MYRYLVCALFATLTAGQVSNVTSAVSSAASSASSVLSSASSVASSALASASSLSSAASSASSAGSSSAASSLSSRASSASSVASSASSAASSITSALSSSISSVISSASSASSAGPTTTRSTSASNPTSTITSSSAPSTSVPITTTRSTSPVVTTSSVVSATETSSIASVPTAVPSSASSTVVPTTQSTSVAPPSSSEPQTTPTPTPSSTSSEVERSSAAPPASSASSQSSASAASSRSSASSAASQSSASSTPETPTYVFTSSSASVSYQETFFSTNSVIITTQPDGQTSQSTQFTVIQTTIPATTLYATMVVTSTESPTGIAGLQAQGLSSGSGGLSTGAKAGIGAGVGVAVVAAAIIGAIYAMRRRKRNNQIADSDRYTPSAGPSLIGGFGAAKAKSDYTDSEMRSQRSPQMRESNPLDRYATPGVLSHRTSQPPNSRTSDISSVSGSEQYRPGPGMPVVVEQSRFEHVNELPEGEGFRPQQPEYLQPGYAGTGGNPFQQRGGGDTPSEYSDDGTGQPHPNQRQASPAALELSGENTMSSAGGQGYRGVDPEQPYHTRSQLTKPLSQQSRFDPSHNF